MDGTFKYCPKNFYQVYNIIGKEEETGKKIPLVYALMSHKSYNLYFHLFNFIKNILNANNVNIDYEKITFTLDFEKAARKALNEIFP